MNTSSLHIGLWFVAAGFALNLLINLLTLSRYLRREPEPREVSFVNQYTLKPDCEKRHAELARVIEGLRGERRNEASQLHDKINTVSREVAALNSATDLIGQRLSFMDAKLDRVIESRRDSRAAE